MPHSADKRFLHRNHLYSALQRDPDLASLPRSQLSPVFQCLFICTGCDFVSYFKTLGKATILNVFFQHAKFISSSQAPGSLHDTSKGNNGYLSFIRLVGTCYFKKHLAAFISLYNSESPVQLYNSLDPSLPDRERHELWLQTIRKTASDRIVHEEERVPSHTALWRHWLRSCWVSRMWQNSPLEDLYSTLPRPEDSGWIRQPNGTSTIDWEAPEVQEKIKMNIVFLLKGCSCRKGCNTKSCGCCKKDSFCGPGCECQGCTNLPVEVQQDKDGDSSSDEGDSSASEIGSSDVSEDSEGDLQTEIITDDFPFTVEGLI